MTRTILCLISVLAVAGCNDAQSSRAERDPNVPPSTPTVTHEAPGQTAEVRAPVSTMPPTNVEPDESVFYVPVPAISGITAGVRIDFLGVFPIGNSDPPQSVAMDLLQNARVLDVRKFEDGTVAAGVGLTVDEIEVLILANDGGEVLPLVRPTGEVTINTIWKATLRESLEDLDVLQEKRQIRRRAKGAIRGSGKVAAEERGLVLQSDVPAGALVPGSQVDIYGLFPIHTATQTIAATNPPPETTPQPHTIRDTVVLTLLQDVDVIASSGTNVQVSVTTEEAKLLALSQERGPLRFSLRSKNQMVSTPSKKTFREVLEDLEVIQEKRQIRIRKKPRKKLKQHTIEIIAGDGSSPSAASRRAPARKALVAPRPNQIEVHQELPAVPNQNAWVETATDKLSTFAADVDSGSFTIARRSLYDGTMPHPASVRPEEWLNYFTYNYPKPTDGPFGVSLEAAPSPFQTEPQYRLLRVGIQGKTFAAKERPPVHLTFLVDVSGSMNAPDKLHLAQRSLTFLVGALQPEDTVAIATYAGRTETILKPTRVTSRGAILAAIGRLTSGGGTAMNDGLQAAYELADSTFVAGHENRVIVLSDGDANIGGTGLNDMLASIEAGAKRGITMSTIGFGTGNYKDEAMEQLANKGNGNYYYIDEMAEARRVFGEQLDATLHTIARDVKLQVEFNPAAVKRYRLVGYENRDIADQDFRNDTVDAGEMGAGHSVTALYELEMAPSNAPQIATVRIRHRKPDNSGPTLETTANFNRADMAEKLADTSHSFRFAAAVAAFAEIIRESPYAKHLNFDWVAEVATGAIGDRDERKDLVELIGYAKRLQSKN